MLTFQDVEIAQSPADVVRPDRMALVVYDMQAGVLGQIEGADAIVGKVKQAIDAARGAGMRIVYMRHLSPTKTWTGAFQMRTALAWRNSTDPQAMQPWFLRDGPGFDIVPDLAPAPEDMILDKLTMSAFEGTPLALLLRDCGLTACALAGVATEIGIEPTVRHAADLGILPVVIRDACGGGHSAAAARAMESLAFMGDAMFTTVGEFEKLLGRPDGEA